EEIVAEKIVLLDAIVPAAFHPSFEFDQRVTHTLMTSRPGLREVDDCNSTLWAKIPPQIPKIGCSIVDVMERINDGDQVDRLGNLRVVFTGEDCPDVGKLLLSCSLLDVLEQFGIDINCKNRPALTYYLRYGSGKEARARSE